MENVALRCELSLSRHKYLVDHLSRTLVWHFKLLFFVLFFFEMCSDSHTAPCLFYNRNGLTNLVLCRQILRSRPVQTRRGADQVKKQSLSKLPPLYVYSIRLNSNSKVEASNRRMTSGGEPDERGGDGHWPGRFPASILSLFPPSCVCNCFSNLIFWREKKRRAARRARYSYINKSTRKSRKEMRQTEMIPTVLGWAYSDCEERKDLNNMGGISCPSMNSKSKRPLSLYTTRSAENPPPPRCPNPSAYFVTFKIKTEGARGSRAERSRRRYSKFCRRRPGNKAKPPPLVLWGRPLRDKWWSRLDFSFFLSFCEPLSIADRL